MIYFVLFEGYRSCSQIQEHNEHGIEKIKLDGKEYDVQCNMSAHPATTIVKVLDAKDIMIQNPALHSKSFPFIRKIEYRGIPVKAVQELVNISEHCKQFVSYKCKNASLFGDEKSPLSYWTTPKGVAKFYWSDCGHDASGKHCNCDFEKNEAIDQGYLTKKQDLPVSEVHFGGLKAVSNVSFTIGDIVCYGG